MNANDAQFLPFLGTANAQFVIPVYQRLYSWTTKDCETLWVDIMRAGKFGHTHFIGSMLYAPEAGGTPCGCTARQVLGTLFEQITASACRVMPVARCLVAVYPTERPAGVEQACLARGPG